MGRCHPGWHSSSSSHAFDGNHEALPGVFLPIPRIAGTRSSFSSFLAGAPQPEVRNDVKNRVAEFATLDREKELRATVFGAGEREFEEHGGESQVAYSDDQDSPGSAEESASVMGAGLGPMDAPTSLPKVHRVVKVSHVAPAPDVQMVNDGGSHVAVKHTHLTLDRHGEQPSMHHDASHFSKNSSSSSAGSLQRRPEHEREGPGTLHDPDAVEEVDDAPVATIIVNKADDKGIHLLPVLGGLIAVSAQLYLWGNVFVTLCKPGRVALPPEQPAPPRATPPAAASRFSGASGQPAASSLSSASAP